MRQGDLEDVHILAPSVIYECSRHFLTKQDATVPNPN